ncbi:tetratricopeptide repeat protein [Lentisalinibacter salinarum]|uniref:tetratricopeptide repeat protein n=1 Tax=Lentisalinibacter salinarum TaxID=2992239 RepID=UPI00386A785B
MAGDRLQALQKLLDGGREDALLRYSLGNEWLAAAEPAEAVPHLERAVELDPGYSAAWKLLGRALTDTGDAGAAAAAYRRGIAVAEERGDKQAAKEMQVFLRRIEKAGGADE